MPNLEALCRDLARLANQPGADTAWPAEQLRLCGEAGVFEWFLPREWGGQEWDEQQIVEGYLALSEACLTTTFVITQRTGACRRIAAGENQSARERLLPQLATNETFASVGISHLTTSGQHKRRPAIEAVQDGDHYVLNGAAPWVTGAEAADNVVIGATVVENDQPTTKQLLIALPTALSGVSTPEPFSLVAVSGSKTGPVKLENVRVRDNAILLGPVEQVMTAGRVVSTGGHETSTLAVGVATAAVKFLRAEADKRADLVAAAESFTNELSRVRADLFAAARGEPSCNKETLRKQANSLVLRSTQAALAAAKGAGFVTGHPVGRWCREALFFMVWSCPQPVMAANLCELAGIE